GLAAVAHGGWKVWHVILAIIFFLGALWGFIEPVDTFFALASVLGFILLFYGFFSIIQRIASREINSMWWLDLTLGILLVLLAIWVSGAERVYALAQRAALALFWVGFFALFKGLGDIVAAFQIRRVGREAAAELAA